MTTHSFTWGARREGNFGFVLETRPDGSRHEFGPMPAHITLAFIAARRTYVEHKMRGIGATRIEDTTIPHPQNFKPY